MTSRRRAGVTQIVLTAKLLGQEKTKSVKAGTRCHVDRNGSNPGEFLVWFSGRYYVRVNAIDLPTSVFLLEGENL